MCAVGPMTATRVTRPERSMSWATRSPKVVLPAAGVAEARKLPCSWSASAAAAERCHARKGRLAGQAASRVVFGVVRMVRQAVEGLGSRKTVRSSPVGSGTLPGAVLRNRANLILATVAALALADASVVALALPVLLRELDTTVEGVAAVLGVYVLVMAVALLPIAALERRRGIAPVRTTGAVLFALASLGCGLSNSLEVLLVFRGLQAVGAAAALLADFVLIDAGDRGRRLWISAAVFGTAAGPAIGGILTQLLSWRWIFFVQIPIALAAAVIAARGARATHAVPSPPASRIPVAPAAALALVAAALTAVLFLLVLELVAGFGVEPIAGAAAVSLLPFAAIASSRIPGPPRERTIAGALLLASGTAALAFLPGSSIAWTLVPQLLAGAGMGLALPALQGELLPEKTAGDAANVLTVRHAGIVAILLIVAPIVSHQPDPATHEARLRGVALALDAQLPPQDKIRLAPVLLTGVQSENPRHDLNQAIDEQRSSFSGAERVVYDKMAERADETFVAAVTDAFNEAFIAAAACALLAVLVLTLFGGEPVVLGRRRVLVTLAALSLLAIPAYAALHRSVAPKQVTIADPCKPRKLPSTGGITGALQDTALRQLDKSACKIGSSREELVLALADKGEAKTFKEKYGVDPRSAAGLIGLLFG